MKHMRIILPVVVIFSVFSVACTDLEEKLEDRLTLEQVQESTSGADPDVSALLSETYISLGKIFDGGQQVYPEHTTDVLIAPTRGGDWDDNGAWRAFHLHNWDADHAWLADYYERLASGLFSALDLLQFNISVEQEAEARFLRALFVFWINDGWGQVPIREPGAPLAELPQVLSSSEAINFVIDELETILPSLLTDTDPWVASQDAAYALLAKAYLNKAVFESEDRQTFSFDAGDMNSVIANCDALINPGNYALEDEYFENFTSDNGENSTELIFCSDNVAGVRSNGIRGSWMAGLHYNQTPSGWNGFTTLADFYNTFEESDNRRSSDLPKLKSETGLNAGFLVGQQYDKDGNALNDRQERPLVFTPESPIMVSGPTLETSGYRILKYVPDMDNEETPGNDLAFFRYADILLMKAEALLRTGDNGGALELVNEVRAARSASDFASVDEASLLAERGREFYWENWRRNDLIRFGKYLDAWDQKPVSDVTYLLFPFSSPQIVANPELQQNPGY